MFLQPDLCSQRSEKVEETEQKIGKNMKQTQLEEVVSLKSSFGPRKHPLQWSMKGSDMPSAVGLVFCVSTIFSKANEDSGELAQNLDVLTFLERSMFIPVQTEEEIAIGKVRI